MACEQQSLLVLILQHTEQRSTITLTTMPLPAYRAATRGLNTLWKG